MYQINFTIYREPFLFIIPFFNFFQRNIPEKFIRLTEGNLASHTRNLEKLGYIYCSKQFIGRRSNTTFSATPPGKEAFRETHQYLRGVFEKSKNTNNFLLFYFLPQSTF
ncbi:transcriptional regulator [Odoribacter laneus]|uniref:transcriptional regulator n=1 Tax=Odoribacter laneus TaxID=626933 RepID=UPI00399233D1